MPEHLQPPVSAGTTPSSPQDDADDLKARSRSPHPYHRQQSELLEPSDRLVYRVNAAPGPTDLPSPGDSGPASNSGTEADDEHFLKGLPAPKSRGHKGLRGVNESLSGSSTPLLSPAVLEEEGRKTQHSQNKGSPERDRRASADRIRRRREVIRRVTEVLLLVCQAGIVATNREVRPFLSAHRDGLVALGWVLSGLATVYPLRLIVWAYRQRKPSRLIPIQIPSVFDPAPMLYPPLIPVVVSLLVAQNVQGAVQVNLVLSICALPRALIPDAHYWETYSWSHWLLSCLPSFFDGHSTSGGQAISQDVLALLYPLHQTLCLILQHFTTTSLLISELQLLSVALINILVLAQSPQAVILKAVLWGGGLALTILCGQVIRWGISLARVPKWRFRRVPTQTKGTSLFRTLRNLWSTRRARNDSVTDYDSGAFSDSDNSATFDHPDGIRKRNSLQQRTNRADSFSDTETIPSLIINNTFGSPSRRHTLPSLLTSIANRSSKTSTPSGRRKRSASHTVRAFFNLTQSQALVRKWVYAAYVFACILGTILIGVRSYVQKYALAGEEEPIGWALGYLFGNLPWFRFQVVQANVERWICLPARDSDDAPGACYSGGWVQHIRHVSLGEANTRLLLSGYFLGIITVGLTVVFQLSPIYEVDTRRKVFHFMMVAMFLPATFIDPAFITLALILMLAIFLLLDLLRASQLPPLSKPIARFLTPYVDGRDLRGPVVISHIFLLVGCAVPLWLSMASLPRIGGGALAGWELPTRDLSMVAGIVCVGLGDAAASLIGRRWGRRKWLWGGGKSVEGSVAFAMAVLGGLVLANVWLHVGGWALTTTGDADANLTAARESEGFVKNLVPSLWEALSRTAIQKMGACATVASLTEAVLTGGNDNVVVPVFLWSCVKGLSI